MLAVGIRFRHRDLGLALCSHHMKNEIPLRITIKQKSFKSRDPWWLTLASTHTRTQDLKKFLLNFFFFFRLAGACQTHHSDTDTAIPACVGNASPAALTWDPFRQTVRSARGVVTMSQGSRQVRMPRIFQEARLGPGIELRRKDQEKKKKGGFICCVCTPDDGPESTAE